MSLWGQEIHKVKWLTIFAILGSIQFTQQSVVSRPRSGQVPQEGNRVETGHGRRDKIKSVRTEERYLRVRKGHGEDKTLGRGEGEETIWVIHVI